MNLCAETIKIAGVVCEVDFYYYPHQPAVLHPYPGHPEEPEDFEIMALRVNGVDILDLIEDLSCGGGIDHDRIIEVIKDTARERDN